MKFSWPPFLQWFQQARSLTKGQQGEQLAARYLRKQGWRILTRNHRNPLGEIDLIALEGSTVVFVEVRTRTGTERGLPAETISYEKQRRLTRAALFFLKSQQLLEHPARFDVITIIWSETSGKEQLNHVKNAFPATE